MLTLTAPPPNVVEFLSHSFPQVNGYNWRQFWLAYLGKGTLGNIPKHTPKVLLFHGSSLTDYSHLLVRNMSSAHLSKLMSSRTWIPLSLSSGSIPPLLGHTLPPPNSAPPWVQPKVVKNHNWFLYHPWWLWSHWFLLPLLSRSKVYTTHFRYLHQCSR